MPSVHREVELKYDVDEAFELPSLPGLLGWNGTAPLSEGDAVVHHLEATYFDTADHRLARAHLTLRRRTGGPDAGWHLKVPGEEGARQEVRLPLGRSATTVPAALQRLVRAQLRGGRLAPVAEVVSDRTVRHLVDATGQVVLEVADDRVHARRLPAPVGAVGVTGSLTGPAQTSPDDRMSWREIEVEVVSGDTDRLESLDSSLRALGLRRAKATSKLARVLDGVGAPGAGAGGAAAPKGKRAATGKRAAKSTAGEVVLAYVAAQVEQILVNDPQVRLDVAGSVHRMRVATRRLRSALQTFKPVVADEVVQPLRAELKWLATELGRARDAEVLRDRLQAAVAEEDQRALSGAVGQTIDATMSDSYRAAHKHLLRSLDSERYHALVQALDTLRGEPPLTPKADRPAAEVLPRRAARAYGRLADLVDAIHDTPPGQDRDTHLHEARKAAKKARYAGETLAEFFGKPATAFAKAMEGLQEELGEHQDSVVMRGRLADLAHRETSPAAAFTYGRLHAEQQHRGELAVTRFDQAWQAASKKSLRSWLG